DVGRLADRIMDVIQVYGQHISPGKGDAPITRWIGRPFFTQKVERQLEKGQAIRMILPAFPWKTSAHHPHINRIDKVIGVLPDLGDELALARLNNLCEDIRAIYPLGGEIHIATDGLIFDGTLDVIGIPEGDTWAYGEELVRIVHAKGYEKNVKVIRVMDILGYTSGTTLGIDLYLSLSQKCRTELLGTYGRTEEEVHEMILNDDDTLSTYCGFIRFLTSDLRHSAIGKNAGGKNKYRRQVKRVAINMMIRAESFTKLLQATYPDYVRLSIHESTGAVKLSVPLIIQGSGEFPRRTPWHSTIALSLSGESKER
ncbi:hypothetical protein K469DRAFT_578921, partial [Zopfia rhizophila CBS 207.26]